MKKRSLMMLLLVGAMTGTMLIGCGGSGSTVNGESDVTAENQQEDSASDVATDETNESGVVNTESTEVIESTGVSQLTDFFGLTIDAEYGVQSSLAYFQPFEVEHPEYGGPLNMIDILANKETSMTEDGKYKQTVIYNFSTFENMTDWTVFIFDAKTGDNLSDESLGHTVYTSEAITDEKGNLAWSVSIESTEELDTVFVWTQVVGQSHDLTGKIEEVTNVSDLLQLGSMAYADTVLFVTHSSTLPDESKNSSLYGEIIGLKIDAKYGEQDTVMWNIPFDAETETGGVLLDLKIKADKEVSVTEEGKNKQTVTYTFDTVEGMSDWTVFIFDAKTGDTLMNDYTVYASETTMSEDGSQVWSATIESDEELDTVFVWTQITGEQHDLTPVLETVKNVSEITQLGGEVYTNTVLFVTH